MNRISKGIVAACLVGLLACEFHVGSQPGSGSPASDGFAARLRADCASPEKLAACQSLYNEVAVQGMMCTRNAPGGPDNADRDPRCAALHNQLLRVRARLDPMPLAVAAKAQAAAQQDIKDQEEQEAKAAAARAARQEEARREQEAEIWMESIEKRCASECSTRVCKEAPDGTPQREVDRCLLICPSRVEQCVNIGFDDALKDCLARYADANGKGTFACEPSLPRDIQGDAIAARTDECTKACAKGGPAALAAARASARAQRAAQLDRIAERERKQQEAADLKAAKGAQEQAADDALRGPAPRNSGWDGSIYCVESYLKERLNDPDSYKHVSTTVPVAAGDTWVVISTYRAKNGFGALMVFQRRFVIQQGKVVSMSEVN